jgi:hypothetical protein
VLRLAGDEPPQHFRDPQASLKSQRIISHPRH